MNINNKNAIGLMYGQMMLSSSSTSKPVWARLLNAPSSIKPLTITMKPNQMMIRNILENYPDHELVRDEESRRHLVSFQKRACKGMGVIKTKVEQRSFRPWVNSDYFGSMEIGRGYTDVVKINRMFRNTIYRHTHYELDISNCWATALHSFLGGESTENLEAWVNRRQQVAESMREMYGVSMATMKKAISATICSYPNISMGIQHDIPFDEAARIKGSDFYKGFVADLGVCFENLKREYPGFVRVITKYVGHRDEKRAVEGQCLMYFAQDVEYAVMNDLMQNELGTRDVFYNYDSVIFPMNRIEGHRDEFVYGIEQRVKEKYGLQFKFAFKDMAAPSFALALSADEIGDSSYAAFKIKFEQEFCVINNPAGFLRHLPSGDYQVLNKDKFGIVSLSYNQDHVAMWRKDVTKRTVEGMRLVVPPGEVPDNYINLYEGLAASRLEQVPGHEVDGLIRRFKEHVFKLVGNNEEYADFNYKLLAHKVQNPAAVPRVMVVFRSLQGTGKDIFFSFLERIFGKEYVAKPTKFGDIFNRGNCHLENKLIATISEADFKDNEQHMAHIKNLVTGDSLVSKVLYQDERIVPNMCMVYAATNNFTAFNPSRDDRRMAIFTCDASHANQAAYFDPLIEDLNNPKVIRAIYQDLMEVDVSEFNPSAARPITEAFTELVQVNPMHCERFLIKFFPVWKSRSECGSNDFKMANGDLRVLSGVVYDDWEQYVQENKIDQGSKMKNTRFLEKLLSENSSAMDKFKSDPTSATKPISLYRSHGKRFKMFQVDVVERWMADITKAIFTDEEVFGDFPEEGPPTKRMRVSEQYEVQHNAPGSAIKYVVIKDGEIEATTNSLDHANQVMGEAYVEKRGDGEVLVQPQTGREFELGQEYMGELGRTKLEAKYPWYVYNRIR